MQKFWLSLILILLLNFLCYPQDSNEDYISDGVKQPLLIYASKDEAKILKAHWKAIGEEIKTTKNPFAGTYSKFGYRGWYLRWSPKNGFVYIFHSEDISIIDYSYGKVEVKDSEITFVPEREMEREFRDVKLKTPTSWISVGNFLVPKEQLADFGNYYAGFGKYQDFNFPSCCDFSPFFSKRGEVKSLTSSQIPFQYKKFFKKPITAEIFYIGNKKTVKEYGYSGTFIWGSLGKTILIPIKINAGKNKGVRKTMIFRLINEPEGQYIQITKVGQLSSQGFIVRELSYEGKETYLDYNESKKDYDNKPFPKLQVGIKVSTSPISDY